MAVARLILLSFVVAVLGYFFFKELQVDTLSLTISIHVPAKRSDVFQKLFDDPHFLLKVHPLCNGVSNIVRFKDKDGGRVVQFDIQERAVLLGLYDTGNFTLRVTCKAIEENTATSVSASLMKGIITVEINQGFHLSDAEGGGTHLEDHASFTAPRILARLSQSQAHAAHTTLLENIRQHFMEFSDPSIEGRSK